MGNNHHDENGVSRQLANLIEGLNSDLLAASQDGLTAAEVAALAGTILQACLNSIKDPEIRRKLWVVIQEGINERFRDGRI